MSRERHTGTRSLCNRQGARSALQASPRPPQERGAKAWGRAGPGGDLGRSWSGPLPLEGEGRRSRDRTVSIWPPEHSPWAGIPGHPPPPPLWRQRLGVPCSARVLTLRSGRGHDGHVVGGHPRGAGRRLPRQRHRLAHGSQAAHPAQGLARTPSRQAEASGSRGGPARQALQRVHGVCGAQGVRLRAVRPDLGQEAFLSPRFLPPQA